MNKANYFLILIFGILLAKTGYSQVMHEKSKGLKTYEFNEVVDAFEIQKYDLRFEPNFSEGILIADCQLTIHKIKDISSNEIPLILYRLMEVHSIEIDRKPVSFDQRVVSFTDWKQLQVNFIRVFMNHAIPFQSNFKLKIHYSGYLAGYTETGMLYVQDHISPKFTILRPDCYAYPVIGVPHHTSNKALELPSFDYIVRTTVPDTLDVVTGGHLDTILDTKHNHKTFIHSNLKPSWRIDVAVADYDKLEGNINVYHFSKDSLGAKQLLQNLEKALNLFSSWWGELGYDYGFSIIEIPNGYGSQADVSAILQSASAFMDASEIRQVYHELSHLWNVKPIGISSRWNEGLATFIEYLAAKKINGDDQLFYVTSWYLDYISKKLVQDDKLRDVPFHEYGRVPLTDFSYPLGMILFNLLYNYLGEDHFNYVLRGAYSEYSETGLSDSEFFELFIRKNPTVVKKIIDDWFYTTDYVFFLDKDYSFQEILEYYRKL